jgi:DNA processing protein
VTLRDAVALSLLPVSRHRLGLAVRASAHPDAKAWSFDRVLARLQQDGGRPLAASDVRTARARAGPFIDRAEAAGLLVVGWADPRYPPLVREIADPPPVLWVRGQLETLATTAVALVGSRAGSPYALAVAERLGYDLAARGVTVVSGLARGVDSAAHAGAVRAPGGRTVAVLGSGVDVIYPIEHTALASAIAAAGALVSELPPGSAPRRAHFPLRNRLISALARAVVIVEASTRSGALITARAALDQGREVMAVPGNVLDERNRGAHALIKDGAKLVETADDILEELAWGRPAPATGGGGSGASDEPLWAQLSPGELYDLDALAALWNPARGPLLAELLRLEVEGRLTRVAGRWMRARPNG